MSLPYGGVEPATPLFPVVDRALLFQGGESSYAILVGGRFDVLVLCAAELQFDEKPSESIWHDGHPLVYIPGHTETLDYFQRVGGKILRCPMDDYKLTPREYGRAARTAQQVAQLVRDGKRVLVTCAEGRNRSGLVNGLALRLLTNWDGDKVIQHIRDLRPRALTNTTFCTAIRNATVTK